MKPGTLTIAYGYRDFDPGVVLYKRIGGEFSMMIDKWIPHGDLVITVSKAFKFYESSDVNYVLVLTRHGIGYMLVDRLYDATIARRPA